MEIIFVSRRTAECVGGRRGSSLIAQELLTQFGLWYAVLGKFDAQEMRYAYGDVDIQSGCGHIQGAVDRDYQRDGAHLRRKPGLIRKYYGIAPDGGSLVGIYLWQSAAAANAFYTSDWVAMVTHRKAVELVRREDVGEILCGVGLLSGPTMFRLLAYDAVALAVMGLGILLAAALALSL